MIGVLVNAGGILLGGLLGLLLKKGIPERVSGAVMIAVGLCTLYIGIDGSLEGDNPVIVILSLVLGTLIGTLIGIDKGLNRLGQFIETKFRHPTGQKSLSEGFVTGSLLFCVGAMAIVGSFNAGLSGDNEILYTKSLIDMISACMLASTLGAGVMLASVSVLVYQGLLVLLSGLLQGVLTDPGLIAEITCVGSLIIVALSLNLLRLTRIKIKVANMLPAMLLVPLFRWLLSFLPM